MNIRIRSMRKAAGLSQTDLGKAIGKSFRTIQTWERDESLPNAESIWAMCELFGCDPNTLLGWYDTHPRESSPSLTQDESSVLAKYRSLAPTSQIAATAMLDGLAARAKESRENGMLSAEKLSA